ncbi:MAG: DNA polymerase/3'-5' exonuclease PolX, partial [Pirellulaceae bacterium]
MTNDKIADTLEQLADLLEFTGTNPFRLRAYRNAARTIRDMTDSIATLVEDEADLTKLEGIGKSVAEKCKVLVNTGKLPQLEELLEEIPKSVLDMLRIPGLGPKRAAVLFNEMNITTLDELKAVCEAEKVRELEGFGAKTEQTILAGMEIAAAAEQRKLWSEVDDLVDRLREHLSKCDAIEQLEIAGSYRRGKETVGDLDILVTSSRGHEVMQCLGEFPEIESEIIRGGTKMSVRLDDGFQIDLRVVGEESFGAALQYFTGSKDHNVIVRGMAKDRGLKINEWGLHEVDGEKETWIAGRTEKELYDALDLPTFPPEIREARREFQWAEAGELPELIELDDIRGDLHMHTTATDAKASIEEMAVAARKMGYKYISITDHSKRVAMANGLDDDRLLEQWEQVDAVSESMKRFDVLKGIEVDILENGDLDISDEVLAQADWVTASVHYGGTQSRDRITKRITDALAHPSISSISHPTGRLLNQREPYEVDIRAVIEAASEHGKFLELNAHPMRLDLNDVNCMMAQEAGVKIVINTDAHSVRGLQ